MLVNTVRENFEGYLRHEVEKSKEAGCIQGMIANPTEREFSGMVHEQLLTNCPVTVQDIDNPIQMFGPDLANLRGEMTRTKPERVRVKICAVPSGLCTTAQVNNVSGGCNVREWLAILGS